jgi:hypothetical protein
MPKWLSLTVIFSCFTLHTACSTYAHIYHGDAYEKSCQRTTALHTPAGSSFTPKPAISQESASTSSLDSYTKPST